MSLPRLLGAALAALAAAAAAAHGARVASNEELLLGFFDASLVETEAAVSARVSSAYQQYLRSTARVSAGMSTFTRALQHSVPTPQVQGTVGDASDEIREFFGSKKGAEARRFKAYPKLDFADLATETLKDTAALKAVPMPSKCRAPRTAATDKDCLQASTVNRLVHARRLVERARNEGSGSFLEVGAEGLVRLHEEYGASHPEAARAAAMVEAEATATRRGRAAERRRSPEDLKPPLDLSRLVSTPSGRDLPAVYVPAAPVKTFYTPYQEMGLPAYCGDDKEYVPVRLLGFTDVVADLLPDTRAMILCVHRYIYKSEGETTPNVFVSQRSTAGTAKSACTAMASRGFHLLPHDLTPTSKDVFSYLCVRKPAKDHFRLRASTKCGSDGRFTHPLPHVLGSARRAPRVLCIMKRKRDVHYEALARDKWTPPEFFSNGALEGVDSYRVRFQPWVVPTQTSILYRKHYHRWFWSPDGKNWMDCDVPLVEGGFFSGAKPTKDHIALIDKIRAHEQVVLGHVGDHLAGLAPWIQARLERADEVSHGFFTVRSDAWLVTPIYVRRHNSKWEWSPDRSAWMSVGEHVVRGGMWNGAHATKENMDLLDALFIAQGGSPKPQPADSAAIEGARKLLDHLQQCVKVHSEKLKPDVFVAAVAGRVGPLVGGVEVVADYDRKDIGHFAFGGLSVGTSIISASVGAAAGYGWKGNQRGVPIIDAYSKWFTSVSAGAETPGIELGVGGSLAFSSDAKLLKYVATEPVCDAVITATAGYSIGVDLSGIPVSVDASSTYYVSHDYLTLKCGDTASWRACFAFWLITEAAVTTGGTGVALVLPGILLAATTA